MNTVDTPHRRRFSVDDLNQMVEVGLVGEDESVELIDGELLVMAPESPIHSSTVTDGRLLLCNAYGPSHVREQHPIHLDVYSLPEPDLAVTTQPNGAFRKHHPTGTDCVLVIEVSRTSRYVDRKKAAHYAWGGVPEYWLVDTVNQTVTVHREPSPKGYGFIGVFRDDHALALPNTKESVTVDALLGR